MKNVEEWHKQRRQEVDSDREAVQKRTVELAKLLGVDQDNSERMNLIARLAILERHGIDVQA